jgi:hypothetical protein
MVFHHEKLRLPGVFTTRESRLPGVFITGGVVLDTGELFYRFSGVCNNLWRIYHYYNRLSYFNYLGTCDFCFQKLPKLRDSDWLRGVFIAGESITHKNNSMNIFFYIWNHSWTCLLELGEVVWWKKTWDKNSSDTVPLTNAFDVLLWSDMLHLLSKSFHAFNPSFKMTHTFQSSGKYPHSYVSIEPTPSILQLALPAVSHSPPFLAIKVNFILLYIYRSKQNITERKVSTLICKHTVYRFLCWT